MWQESTDLTKAPNSAANGLCVLGIFSEPQRILDYITVSQSTMLHSPVKEVCVCVCVCACLSVCWGGFQSSTLKQSLWDWVTGSSGDFVATTRLKSPSCPPTLILLFSNNPLP